MKLEEQLLKKPPTIRIREQDGMHFKIGSAAPSPEFIRILEEKTYRELDNTLNEFGDRVNTILIVGHTDTQPIRHGNGNLDEALLPALHDPDRVDALIAGSNADLGLMRAVSVRKVLLPLMTKSHPTIKIRCLSAAGAVALDGNVTVLPESGNSGSAGSQDDENRRRIEILFLGLTPDDTPSARASDH